MTKETSGHTGEQVRVWGGRIVLIAVWAAIIIAFALHRENFTISEILEFTPSNPVLAAIVMLALFALKSISIVLYSGILYAVDGILFPLPAAIAVNILGTVVMVTIPYLLGKKTGAKAVDKITARYPKAAHLREMRQENDFFFVLLVRLIGRLPSDVVSMYMGAVNVDYKKYLLGCVIGMLPSTITFPIMGMNLTDVHSREFRLALGIQILFMASSILIYYIYKKRRRSR